MVSSINSITVEKWVNFWQNLYYDSNLANVSAVKSLIERGVELKTEEYYYPLHTAILVMQSFEGTYRHFGMKVFLVFLDEQQYF